MKSIENQIHVEVLKLYPDAELPHFEIETVDEHTLNMTYFSSRKLHSFAKGLIMGCLNHYEEKASMQLELIEKDGSVVNFTITKE